MAAASDVISNRPSLPLFNHPPTYLLLFFISILPVCLHSMSFYPSLHLSPAPRSQNEMMRSPAGGGEAI